MTQRQGPDSGSATGGRRTSCGSRGPAVAPHPARERKRRATYRRIAAEAARLVAAKGIAGTTIDEIAQAADVGRATFFRYFDTKELAVAVGFSGDWIETITGELARQPSHLDPIDAVRAAFRSLSRILDDNHDLVLFQAELSRTSPALEAWTLLLYLDFEAAIAETLAPRFRELLPGDPRPRMLGAMTMAAIRLALDAWVADGGRGDLATMIERGLASIAVGSPGATPAPKTTRRRATR